jgi:flagellar motor protein MotB
MAGGSETAMRNRRRKKPDDGGPSKAYMLSFGNMMTAQLAFFIVLNSLAQDQTGANLHAGTGSFVRSL